MCNRHASDRQLVRAIAKRGPSVARRVILLVAAGLVCMGLRAVPCAAVENGGQQFGPQNYQKLWTQDLTDEQCLQLFRQRVHQPMSVWYGVGTGMIEATGSSFSSSGLNFET
ncbi:MAG: hypothetical protein ACM3VT_17965, partial [Solirubrobacterales bacterium]